MKLSSALLQSVALGISVSVAASACRPDEVKTGDAKPKKNERPAPKEKYPDNCPACGMG